LLSTDSDEVLAKAVLIATGSDYNRTGIPGEDRYYARGVHFCATCDGAFYRDKRLVVIGGGNSAIQETLFLTRYATHIDILVRSTLKASDVLIKELQPFIDKGKVSLHLGVAPKEIVGDESGVTKVVGTADNKEQEFVTDGVFVFIGLKPNTAFLADSGVKLNPQGFVITDINLETSVAGIFAAGDVRSGATMQIASASGEGATAALKIREYLEGRLHQTELRQLEVMP
ncbi:MAG: NAD(P)/FAD-dependent oxidoreductase, partial [Candidatus Saccharimonadales bacterium]